MIVYFILLLIVVLAAFQAGKVKYSTETRLFLVLMYVAMVLVAGLRDRTVGTDTGSYVNAFMSTNNFSDIYKVTAHGEELGLAVLGYLVHQISDEYPIFLTAIALIVIGCYQYLIVNYSSRWVVSNFVFITMGFYTFFFNGARQGIACAICALAIGPLIKRKFAPYLIIVLLATLFHKTAIVMLPIYFIVHFVSTNKTNLLCILIGVGVTIKFNDIVEVSTLLDERYKDYSVVGAGGGYYTMALNVTLLLFFSIFRKHVQLQAERDRYDIFLKMFEFGTIISVISAALAVNPSGFLRFTLYFSVSIILLWPIVFNNISNRTSKYLITYSFFILHIVIYTIATVRFSNLVPYTFNSDILAFLPLAN